MPPRIVPFELPFTVPPALKRTGDPYRAVRLALDLEEPMRCVAARWTARGYNIAYGVGIALGYATLGVIGFDTRADYTALGSVVNLAARLSDEAAPGEVLLDLRAHAAVQTEFEFGPARELELKGISAPVTVHNVLSAKS